MPIPIDRDDLYRKLNHYFHELDVRLIRIEQALLEINSPAQKEVKKPIVKKK